MDAKASTTTSPERLSNGNAEEALEMVEVLWEELSAPDRRKVIRRFLGLLDGSPFTFRASEEMWYVYPRIGEPRKP